MLSLHQLRCFLTVYELGSLTAAAEELGYAQPSISEQIRTLEKSIGLQLFRRVGRGVVPTTVADTLRPHAEATIAAAEEALRAVQQVKAFETGTIRFGMFGSARLYVSATLVTDVLERYPGVRVEIIGLNSSEVLEDLRRGRIEAALIAAPPTSEGLEVLPERRQQNLEQRLGLTPGDVRDRRRVDAARSTALNVLQEMGYPYAKVTVDEQPGESARGVTIVIRATPGQAATFGPIEVSGNASVGEDVILRQLAFKPGDRYSAGRVRASQSKLSSLDLFRFAYVEPRGINGEGGVQAPAVPMRITVAEDKHRQLSGAVGYGTEEKARVRGEWRHVNFLGGARTLGLESKYSSLDRGVRLNFGEPWFFTRHLSFSAQAQTWDEREPVYPPAAEPIAELEPRGRDGERQADRHREPPASNQSEQHPTHPAKRHRECNNSGSWSRSPCAK